MWGNKNPEPPARSAVPEKPASAPASIQPPNLEEKKMAPNEPIHSLNPSGGNGARLGASLHVKGEITGNEDLQIDGTVEGLVQLDDRKLTVGASAKVTADIVSREVVVYGNVKGNLRARDRIEIKKDGSVVGDLTTARIMIEDGAYFKGSIEIDKTGGEASGSFEKPAFARSSSGSAKTAATASD